MPVITISTNKNTRGKTMRRHILSVLGFMVASFGTQATSHFVVFARHYATVTIFRADTIFALGIATMIIEGAILSYAFANSRFVGRSLMGAVCFAWLFGAFLVSYIALGEAAKYNVTNIPSWIAVEVGVGFAQFTLAGIFLGLAHRGRMAV
jgi:hypothetical protein